MHVGHLESAQQRAQAVADELERLRVDLLVVEQPQQEGLRRLLRDYLDGHTLLEVRHQPAQEANELVGTAQVTRHGLLRVRVRARARVRFQVRVRVRVRARLRLRLKVRVRGRVRLRLRLRLRLRVRVRVARSPT